MKKEYKVLIIGPRHSGKTVFLSSMYYNLAMQTNSTKFVLKASDHNSSKVLLERYQNLNTEKKWPEATTNQLLSYEFQCLLKTRGGNYEAFKVTYYDYSGGRINDATVDDENEFQELMDTADIHLGLIDGERLLRSMKDRSYTSEFYLKELDRLIIDLGLLHKENTVVHFLISKWDLLKSSGYSVAEVKAHLGNYERFSDFAQNILDYDGKIRFIPVSAVGFDFLEYDGDGYKPKQGGILKPYNVDIPLSLALIDSMEMVVKELEEEEKTAESQTNNAQSYHVPAEMSFLERLKRGAGKLAHKLRNDLHVDIEILDQIVHWKSIGDDKIE